MNETALTRERRDELRREAVARGRWQTMIVKKDDLLALLDGVEAAEGAPPVSGPVLQTTTEQRAQMVGDPEVVGPHVAAALCSDVETLIADNLALRLERGSAEERVRRAETERDEARRQLADVERQRCEQETIGGAELRTLAGVDDVPVPVAKRLRELSLGFDEAIHESVAAQVRAQNIIAELRRQLTEAQAELAGVEERAARAKGAAERLVGGRPCPAQEGRACTQPDKCTGGCVLALAGECLLVEAYGGEVPVAEDTRLLDALVSIRQHDQKRLREIITELKQADGEKWAVGELLESAILAHQPAAPQEPTAEEVLDALEPYWSAGVLCLRGVPGCNLALPLLQFDQVTLRELAEGVVALGERPAAPDTVFSRGRPFVRFVGWPDDAMRQTPDGWILTLPNNLARQPAVPGHEETPGEGR